ncbi:hypothetical protein HMPREF1392_00460 [Helicobacter pylori GAM101Biv]|nr:hypothetical protein HMPREF1392_00460 [Helicobacter pylori GAM101Biv]
MSGVLTLNFILKKRGVVGERLILSVMSGVGGLKQLAMTA